MPLQGREPEPTTREVMLMLQQISARLDDTTQTLQTHGRHLEYLDGRAERGRQRQDAARAVPRGAARAVAGGGLV